MGRDMSGDTAAPHKDICPRSHQRLPSVLTPATLDLHLQVKENESVLRAVEDEKKRLETTIGELRQQLQVADKPSDVKVMQAILDFETKGEFDAGAINELEANLVEKTEDLKAKIRQLNAANEDATFAF